MAGVIRVAVVDDHPATAEGLAALLAREEGIIVVGTASSVAQAQARELIDRQRVDVLICDIELGGHERGFELLERPHPSHPAVVFLSAYDYPAFHALALERGAAGYLSKTASIREIAEAVRSVSAGGTAFSRHGVEIAGAAPRRPSDRELQVIAGVAAGNANETIARALGVSPATVESHLRRMFARYAVRSRTELAMLAIGQGWMEAPHKPPEGRSDSG